jgi:hypothetical protein
MSRILAVLLLLTAVFPLSQTYARAQVSPAANEPLRLYAYAMATGLRPELGQGTGLGGSGGFILEHSRLVALDFRGVAVAARVPLHTIIAEIGPRFAPRYGRLQPYAEVLGGLGHSEYNPPAGTTGPSKGYGLAWAVNAGLDLRLKYRFEWRVAEYDYNHIYVGTGVSPTTLHTGLVYRF